MSLSHVTFLIYVGIMSYRLRLNMTTPFRQNYGHNERLHLFNHRALYPARYGYSPQPGLVLRSGKVRMFPVWSKFPHSVWDRTTMHTRQSRIVRISGGWLAGWQPVVYSKTAARLLKAAWCLLRIATPYAVLRRLTVVAVRPAARHLHGPNLPPSHSSISSARTRLPFSFLLLFRPFGLNTISLKSELLWDLTCTISNFPPSFSFLSFLVFCLL